MSHVIRAAYQVPAKSKSEGDVKKITSQRKWKTVEIHISQQDLEDNIDFLNDAVVIRQSPEGVPLMTTTAIYGPIRKGEKVALTPGKGTGVTVIQEGCTGETLIDKLAKLQSEAPAPDKNNATTVQAMWLSSDDGGAVPSLDAAANVFGGTGSLYVNESAVVFPVLDVSHPDYDKTLAFYGGKLLKPEEEFYMGFDLTLFGMEYNTSLPDYIRSYAFSPHGGGGMFIEHHPFPHIFLPKPARNDQVYCEAKVTLGRKVDNAPPRAPRFMFSTFRIPSDGSAIVIKPDAIHNDSFTNGRLAVFVADTAADTVAFRETSPFKEISVKDI